MKKLFLFFIFVCSCISTVFAQFNVSGTYVAHDNPTGVDFVYVFNGLTGAQITYTDTEERIFNWKKYTCTSAPEDVLTETEAKMSTTLYNLEDATGYILEKDDEFVARIFVFNYNNYASSVNSLFVPEKDCYQTSVSATVLFTEMEYCAGNGTTQYKIPRIATLSYKSLTWSDNAEKFEDLSVSSDTRGGISSNIPFSFELFDVYKDTTTFVLYGDQFVKPFRKDSTSLKDEAVKPLIKAWSVITTRTADNERNQKTGGDSENQNPKGTRVEGSAPVDVTLTVHTNLPGGFYRWQIVNIERPTVQIGQSTEPSFLYTFNEYGIYTARVEVTTERERCIKRDSVEITVWESELEVPNVFTPNDDGINDKFCVAYKSIVKYDMWVYNRWGRLVFHSNSPEICWDGYIGNAKAPTGAYFYVIDAVGADGRKYRGKEYSGDINLLR